MIDWIALHMNHDRHQLALGFVLCAVAFFLLGVAVGIAVSGERRR